MGRFLAMPPENPNVSKGASVVWQELQPQWPCVADVLCGVEPADGLEGSCPALSIILFVEGASLKFCLSRYKGTEKAFGTIGAPSKGLDGLEAALAAGDYEWVSKRAKR